ncbi:hypothetical protein ABW20_dc0103184 [Dactylellina cionopaga]|nr:hypothetical protein ABW20_dc0103184 [Dactylellina cionopaga]
MVGIGGGVPKKVRLGDVVVSTPVGQFPGVVQWDLGKAKEGGSFERTGALNNPPALLLSALTKLETEHDLEGSRIDEYLDQLKEKHPRLASKYLRSESLKDELFRSDYSHISKRPAGTNNRDEEDREEDEEEYEEEDEEEDEEDEGCRFCERANIVRRKPRKMRVHYGLIASGNQAIRDATFRDKLNKDLDSHKNKAWQDHAAAVAAAFAKELIGYVQPKDVEGEKAAKDLLIKGWFIILT